MLTARLPPALEDTLAALVGPGGGHAAARTELTRRYRDRDAPRGPVARGGDDVLAYAAARLPATYGAVRVALGELYARGRVGAATHLDLGAGPGTALWAAADLWPSPRSVAVEAEPAMARLGRELAPQAEWTLGRLPDAIPAGAFDLVTVSYVLGELDTAAREATVDRAWHATAGALALVEPGTPDGYERIVTARERLIAAGGTVAAPCPHDRTCPLAGTGDWCHFAVRVARSRAHRLAKEGRLGHEDEKFSYVVVTRDPAPTRATARVLRHPQVRSGHVLLRVCAPDGVRAETVSRRDGERYRRARKVSWGEDLGD